MGKSLARQTVCSTYKHRLKEDYQTVSLGAGIFVVERFIVSIIIVT
jgi:hypothetical protein